MKNTLLPKPLQQESGAIITLTALLIPLMLSMMGIGYDVGNLYMHKARLQNMADAAALAGGKEYLDKLDVSEEGGTVQDGETIDNHPNTDRVAKNYVTKNSINLPNSTISHDFNSLKVRLSNTDGKTPYFRVGLQEYVNLHFLPIISGLPKSQLVRAEGIAVLVKGTPGTGTGSSGSSNQKPLPSAFNNLFTFSDSFITENVIEDHIHNFNINASFKGDIAYTNYNQVNPDKTSQTNMYYNTSGNNGGDSSPNNHFYESKVNGSSNKINDPIINTLNNTEDYVTAFQSWLSGPHIEITNHNHQNLSASDINNYESNVIHYNYSGNLNIHINGAINATENYNIYTPVYIIIEPSIHLTNINMSNNDGGRPVVLVYLGEEELWFQNANNFSGVIYAPYAKVNVNFGGTFLGNIVAESIQINSSNKGTWIQKNFLENYELNEDGTIKTTLYEDNFIKNIDNTVVKQRIIDANNALTDTIKAEIATAFGVSSFDNLDDMNSFQQKTYAEKRQFYESWKTLYDKYKNNETVRNILWPWNEYFNVDISEEETPGTPDNIRLINPRIEANPFSIGL